MVKRKNKNNNQSPSGHLNDDETYSTDGKPRMIHPIIIYPFVYPKDVNHIEALYERLVKKLAEDKEKYHHPITILNCQTFDRNRDDKEFNQILNEIVKTYSDIRKTWSVDTCQMWLTGFGYA